MNGKSLPATELHNPRPLVSEKPKSQYATPAHNTRPFSQQPSGLQTPIRNVLSRSYNMKKHWYHWRPLYIENWVWVYSNNVKRAPVMSSFHEIPPLFICKTFELACKRPNNVVTQPSRNTLSRSETQMGKSPYKKLENTFDTDMLVKPTKLTFSQKIKKILMKMKVKEYKAERFILFCSSYGLVMLCAVLGFLGLAFKIISW